jgi:hypothetical protein
MPNNPDLAIADGAFLTLENAYKTLLERRQLMTQGLLTLSEQSAYHRFVIVDALISGLMAHFHEVARNQSAHKSEIETDGQNLDGYVSRLAAQVVSVFTQLPESQTAATQATDEGRTRAVRQP